MSDLYKYFLAMIVLGWAYYWVGYFVNFMPLKAVSIVFFTLAVIIGIQRLYLSRKNKIFDLSTSGASIHLLNKFREYK